MVAASAGSSLLERSAPEHSSKSVPGGASEATQFGADIPAALSKPSERDCTRVSDQCFDRNLGVRSGLRINDSCDRLRIVSAVVYRIRNIGDNSPLNGHISPQLAFRTPAH